ncbi:hypothetical protein FHX39_002048 [Friedmanniella antarctica]|uniref:Uncharacterized protein n=1 Tax=Microlunatus antarcticus TaxID=53388 RepID=A0A7W5JVM6_9ACTN|nr:hypothetical protein [Microlunatus antarcticus]
MRPVNNAHVDQVDGRNWTEHGWYVCGAGATIGFGFAAVSILTSLWCHSVPAPTASGFDMVCPRNTGLAAGLFFCKVAGSVAVPALWVGGAALLDALVGALRERRRCSAACRVAEGRSSKRSR